MECEDEVIMANFITHYNNKYELINLDLLENVGAVMDVKITEPIKDSDGLFTLLYDFQGSDQYVEKFTTVNKLKRRLDDIRHHQGV